jgi:hypothetical protein
MNLYRSFLRRDIRNVSANDVYANMYATVSELILDTI